MQERGPVHISFSEEDRAWRDLLAGELNALGVGVTTDVNVPLVVGLISRHNLASQYPLRDLWQSLTAVLIPVLVSPCPWRDVPWLAEIEFYNPDKPLSEEPDPKAAVQKLAQYLADRLTAGPAEPPERIPVSAVTELPLSDETRGILNHAVQRFAAPTSPFLTSEALIVTMADAGRRRKEPRKTPQILWEEIVAAGGADRHMAHISSLPEKPGPDVHTVTRDTLEIFQMAGRFSEQTGRKGHIGARHFGAALLQYNPPEPTRAILYLRHLGVDLDRLRGRFRESFSETFPEEAAAWREIFPVRDGEGQPPVVLPGYHADEWRGADLLNVLPDVNALATVVAAWTVEPPLSIGLFGDWGSGKTTFMHLMMDRVEKLARVARKSKKPQRECGYYKNIVQIEFNAWHYMEGNLWASLVEHIFSRLQLYRKERGKPVEDRQRKLLQDLKIEEQLQEKALARRRELEAQEREARERADRASTQIDGTAAELERVRKDFWSRLELGGDAETLLGRTIRTGRDLYRAWEEARTLTGRIRAHARFIKEQPNFGRLVVWAGLAAAFVPAASYVVERLNGSDLAARITQLAGAAAAAAAWLRPYMAKVRQALSVLDSKAEAIRKAEAEQEQQVRKLEAELDALTRQRLEAEQEAEQKKERIRELQAEIAQTTAGRLLAEFIQDRAVSSDYRQHLGVLAVIRRDFEKLADLFEEQRKAEKAGEERQDENTINRIILYIDDLDRCPPKRVVEVLQAIHLLLAFPMFVVVVGVDSRWVSRSLEDCYKWLVPGSAEEPGAAESSDMTDGAGRSRRGGATAHDYLEKIFQIPFWLSPLEDTTCQSLIAGLTGEVPTQTQKKTDVPTDQKTTTPERPVTSEEAGRAQGQREAAGGEPKTPPTQGTPSAEEEHYKEEESDAGIALMPASLTLTPNEVKFMNALSPVLGRSPRAVKRFINCYRLIKARLTPKQLDAFVGPDDQPGSYREVMALLAVITGAPTISDEFFRALSRSKALEDLPTAAQPEWSRVKAFLKAQKLEDATKLRSAATFVTRYSFRQAERRPAQVRRRARLKPRAG